MEKMIHDNNANNNKQKDKKLKENKRPPGKPLTLRSIGGISQETNSSLFFVPLL
jgi:hypothetical protein